MQKLKVFRKEFLISLLISGILGGMMTAYSQSDFIIGDVNSDGKVTIVDALMIAQYYVNINPPGFFITPADVNLDGTVTIVDALIVAQYYVGLIKSLPYPSPSPVRTNTPTWTPVGTPTPTKTLAPVATQDNPFTNAVWYTDPEWSAQAAAGGGRNIAYYNTGIWLNNSSSITAGNGLRGHLDNALAQHANLITIVLNRMPGNCDDWTYFFSGSTNYGWYNNEFIDPIVAILSDPAYWYLRKVIILEPDTLPNLVTNLISPNCNGSDVSGGFVIMTQYALNKLNTVSNVYVYVDIGNSGWLGWDSNFSPAVDLISSIIKGTTAGVNGIAGFISNTATYTPVEEPFLPDPNLQIGGQPVKSSTFYEWNSYFDELKYVQAMRTAFINRGFPATIGMVIDTSRNGWGGPDRPAAESTSPDLDTYVDESRIDRRQHRGNWCNQPGGIGERPCGNPAPGIDAYIWAWPPGLSDGISREGIVDPDDPNLTFDPMCDPNGFSRYNANFRTGAIPAPHFGRWNQAHFDILLQNAYPPLTGHAAGNPFADTKMYVNPDWSEKAAASGAAAIANTNTAVWLDSIGAITNGRGLRGHLDGALSQGANLILLVLYDLPNRSCQVKAPNGEFSVQAEGLLWYKTEFIDPIVALLADPAYKNLRIVTVIEPNSLPNLITCMDIPLCAEASSSGVYVQGIQYALNQLNKLPNTYCYIDAAFSGWLGWDSNFRPAVDLITNVIKGTTAGVSSICGFITNVANYTPLEEIFLPDPNLQKEGKPVKAADFFEWNLYFDELKYAQDLHSAFISKGFPSSIGMLIDTSRNGWGGPDRPKAVSTSLNLNTYVNESRIDRRLHRGNWCNQPAGIGERPRANPAPRIDAYVWAWEPGYSDGVSVAGTIDPFDPSNTFDKMCDPNGFSKYNSAYRTGAMTAPHFRHWNQAHFDLLYRNIYPPL